MDEHQWDVCDNAYELLKYVGDDEKNIRRIFCVFCRRFWDKIPDKRSRASIKWAENYLDGKAFFKQRTAVYRQSCDAWHANSDNKYAQMASLVSIQNVDLWTLSRNATPLNFFLDLLEVELGGDSEEFTGELRALADLVRCVLANPYRVRPRYQYAWGAWHDGVVLKLAQTIHEKKDFFAMPILADALEEAGCTNSDILNHCRSSGSHAPGGCWVINLLLGKK